MLVKYLAYDVGAGVASRLRGAAAGGVRSRRRGLERRALKGANEADLEGGSREGVVWAKIPLPASGVTWRMGGLVGGSAGECGLVRESKASGC